MRVARGCRLLGAASIAIALFTTSAAGAPTLVKALAFGSRDLTCSTFNDPGTTYEVVHHSGGDAAAAAALAYDAGRGWGYEVLFLNPAAEPVGNPVGERNGFGQYGWFDDSVNNRDAFGDSCPEELYDSFIGAKNFSAECSEATVGDRTTPCAEADLDDDGFENPPEGIIFRVDVPNGKYRFVAAVGSATNRHAHRILAEDGGTGLPEDIGPDHVVLVHNFDQGEYCAGTFARVGFGCFIPPPASGPGFVNMDIDGNVTLGQPISPTLEVTQGFIRIHCLQANANDGACGTRDPNGGDLVVLELWDVGDEVIDPGVPPPDVVRTITPGVYDPGVPIDVTLDVTNVPSPATIAETIPAGFTVSATGGGQLSGGGRTLTFTVTADVQLIYEITPDGCANGQITGVIQGDDICPGVVSGDADMICGEGLTTDGGIRVFLMIGPIDLGANHGCFDEGQLDVRDYMTNGAAISESTVLAKLGDEIVPDFGGAASGVGVQTVPNPAINPKGAAGVLTVWRGITANDQGQIDYQDANNFQNAAGGDTDDFVQYCLVYLENTTGNCKDITLEVGSDDGHVLLVNGKIVGDIRPFEPDTCRGVPGYGNGDMLAAALAPGKNVVLLKTCERGGGAGARLVVRNPDGTPLNDGSVVPSLTPPGDYPDITPTMVVRTIDPSPNHRQGEEIEVTLAVTGGVAATIVETIPLAFEITDTAGGSVVEDPDNGVQTLTLTATGTEDITYKLAAPLDQCDCNGVTIIGSVSSEVGCSSGLVTGEAFMRCILDYPSCLSDQHPLHPNATLAKAFAFGVHPELGTNGMAEDWCETPNQPGIAYIAVEQADRVDADGLVIQPGPEYLAYEGNEARGWGFVVQVLDTSVSPWGDRNGWGIFGPMDESANNRNDFANDTEGAVCAEELYDSFIGNKNYQDTRAGADNANLVCRDADCPDGEPCTSCDATWPVQGMLFRVDVPNGTYKFVMAVGDADNRHAHRIIAENGGDDTPNDPLIDTDMDAVTLVYNFDQPQYAHGEPEADAQPGEGIFARVGFDGREPPIGDGTAPDPQFVNMDAEGKATTDCANSPALTVTEDYITFHCLQANNTAGCGGGQDGRGNGSDLVILEIWEVGGTGETVFKRGDSNRDGGMNIADAVYILQNLFAQGPAILCPDAADSNDDEGVNIADAVYILQNLFAQGPAIPAPGPDVCGPDLTGHPTGGADLPACDYCSSACQVPPVACPPAK